MKSFLPTLLFFSFTLLAAQNPQEGWAFRPPEAGTSAGNLLSLRYLNEDVAGENGFVQLSPDGESFVTEKGGAIRFWAIGGGNKSRKLSMEGLRDHARFLAQKGVKMHFMWFWSSLPLPQI